MAQRHPRERTDARARRFRVSRWLFALLLAMTHPPAEAARAEAPTAAPTSLSASARFERARAAAARGDEETAAREYAQITDGPLAPWARIGWAELALETNPAAARDALRPLADTAFAGQLEARRMLGRALAAAGPRDEALRVLRALVDEAPAHTGAATPGLPLAGLLRSGSTEERVEALALYRRVASRVPLSALGASCREDAAEVLRTLPPPLRRAHAEPTFDDALFALGAQLRSRHLRDVEREARALARRDGITAAQRCQADLLVARALDRRRERRRAADRYRAIARSCDAPEVVAEARYREGRARARDGDRAGAREAYRALLGARIAHRLTDDAGVLLAELEAAAGRSGAEEDALRAVLELPEVGDRTAIARVRLGLHALDRGDASDAIALFESGTRAPEAEDREDLRGQSRYWLAQSLDAAGRHDEARRERERLVAEWPLAFYAQLALVQLPPERAEAALRAWRDAAPSTAPSARPDERRTLREARALHDANANPLARAALTHGGLLEAGASARARYEAGVLLSEMGDRPGAMRQLRAGASSYRRSPPAGEARARWEMAYPRPFADGVARAVRESHVDAHLLFAIAREESNFDPTARSHAGARGLTQLMLPTARAQARRLRVRMTAAALRDPTLNLRLGARFVATLDGRLTDRRGLVPSAYNAGYGNVRRWLEARGDLPFDRFVETIPFDETRRYTRRVCQSWGVYRFLAGEALPTFASAPTPTRAPARTPTP